MKNKKTFVVCSILQILLSILSLCTIENTVDELMKTYETSFAELPNLLDLSSTIMKIIGILVKAEAIVAIIIGIIILILAIKNKMIKNGLTITLIIISLVVSPQIYVFAIDIIMLISLLKSKNKNEEVSKVKECPKKLKRLKVTTKDYLLSILLIVIYSSQFLLEKVSLTTPLVIIAYYAICFMFSIFVFKRELTRDFKELKENFTENFKYIVKKWLLTYGIMILANLLVTALTGSAQSANQMELNAMPLLIVVPLSIIWAPIVEESIFRGTIRRFIKNDIVYIIVSGVVFGLLHTFTSETGIYNIIVHAIPYGLMGAMFAKCYTKTNNLTTNIGMHCLQNTFASILMILLKILGAL